MGNRYLDFEEYIMQSEPQKKERAEAWRVAIGMLNPNSPRHPKQKYLLTVKGIALYNELTKEN